MADVKWTKEQQEAIDVRNSKVLVAAGAGSGKTAVLVERIIRKVIDDKVDIDKMLIVTFTNAAASEMKERIRARLYDEVNTNPSLQRQILYLNRSSIMTIDAFCKKAIKDYFYKIDIDPNFKIADNTEDELLRLEAIDEVLEELYETNNVNIIEVLDAYSNNKSDENLVNLILTIHKFIQSCPKPLEWLAEKCDMYNTAENDFSDTPWGKMLIRYTRKTIQEIIEELKTVEEELLPLPDAINYLQIIQEDIFKLEALRKNNFKWDDYYEEFRKIEFSALKRAPKLDEETRKYVQDARKKMKSLIDDYFKEKVYISTSEEILKDIEYVYANLNVIYSIVKAFDEKFKKKKSEKNLLDFSDIEHLCLKLFEENEDVVRDFKNKYSEILIDEYQDSNLIQEEILTKIANDSVFMVGDVKQSIYKFRQAKPELFLEKYNSYTNYEATNNSKENKILLFKNFRSNENIIDEVNFIFKNIMFKETGEIDYTEREYLKFGASYYPVKGKTAELHIIDKKVSEEDAIIVDDDIEEKPQLEARVVAKRIEELVDNFEIYDKNTKSMRKATYSDIVILLRATKGYTETLSEEMAARNIPVYVDVKSGYFDNAEVQIILSLLKIIDNPYQDIPLLAVLRSPIGGFDVNELTKIRMYDKKCSFYDALIIAMTNGDKKAKAFVEKLVMWREKSRYQAIDEFVSYLYENTGYYYYVSLLPNGEARQNNLKVLLKKAGEYSKSSFKGLYNFLIFIENVKTSSGDFDAPSELSESDNVVRIMSIHKSKGLEFPIVFLCGTGRKFNTRDLSNKIIFHQDLGLGVDIINVKKRITYESIPKLAIKLQNQRELLAEEMRILYVAMTRAREKLIITALTQNLDKRVDEWEKPISMYGISNAKNYADWICKVALSKENDWKIKMWSYEDVLEISQPISQILNKEASMNKDFENENKYIRERFNWIYPYITSTKLPSKMSVSELKRLNDIYDYTDTKAIKDIEVPDFIDEKATVGVIYGTLLHNKMEKLDFNKLNVDEILENVEEKETRKRLKNDIEKFLNSKLFEEIKHSNKIHKETPFNLNMTAREVFKVEDASANDEIMVQGVIDLYCEYDDGIIVIDYKSDKLFDENEFKNRYKSQLEYYKRALETTTGKKVKGTYIYSFSMGKEIKT